MPRHSRHRACDDFRHTSEATRRGWLGDRAGLTRRQVIGRGVAGGLAVYAAQALSFSRTLEAASADAAAAPNAPILVSVFLPGGCDLLDTFTPLDQYGTYADLRQATRVEGEVPKLGSTGLGVHPALSEGLGGGIKGLFDQGKIGLLPGIDYANPDLSHFHSRHFWESGLITSDPSSGWLGRWLDRNGNASNPLQGLSAGYELSPVMRSGRAPVAAVDSPASAQFWFRDVWGESDDAARHAWAQMSRGQGANPAQAAAHASSRFAQEVAARLAPYREDDKGRDPLASKIAYPQGDFADSLRHLAAMLSLPLGVRVASVEAPGDFDTHDNQRKELADSLGRTSAALAAFQADLEARGVADRVLTLVWSEFGRRPEANVTGTDHGAGGLAWVQGTHARSGVLSDYPDLKRLDHEDNLAVTVDFRRVYASLIEQWLKTDAAAVIPNAGALGRIGLVA